LRKRASQITAAKAKCPNTKLIVSGYSQGGQIIHKAAAQLSAATAAWISKVVIFGDPCKLLSTTFYAFGLNTDDDQIPKSLLPMLTLRKSRFSVMLGILFVKITEPLFFHRI
jgi:hypothetical protein